jgi:hypothetical protein
MALEPIRAAEHIFWQVTLAIREDKLSKGLARALRRSSKHICCAERL